MPRSKSSNLDKARQAFLRNAKKAKQAAQRRAKQRQKAAQVKRENDLVAKWRALRKGGVIETKVAPSRKALTPSRIRSINKAFKQLQKAGHYDMGRVFHPLQRESYQTPSGKKKEHYVFTDYFKPIKTKQKLEETSDVIKTRKGYIVEKNKDAQVSIRDGELRVKSHGIIWTKKVFKGEDVLKFYQQVKDGDIRLNQNHFVSYSPFGSPNILRTVDNNEDFVAMMDEYRTNMHPDRFKAFVDLSEFSFGRIPHRSRR